MDLDLKDLPFKEISASIARWHGIEVHALLKSPQCRHLRGQLVIEATRRGWQPYQIDQYFGFERGEAARALQGRPDVVRPVLPPAPVPVKPAPKPSPIDLTINCECGLPMRSWSANRKPVCGAGGVCRKIAEQVKAEQTAARKQVTELQEKLKAEAHEEWEAARKRRAEEKLEREQAKATAKSVKEREKREAKEAEERTHQERLQLIRDRQALRDAEKKRQERERQARWKEAERRAGPRPPKTPPKTVMDSRTSRVVSVSAAPKISRMPRCKQLRERGGNPHGTECGSLAIVWMPSGEPACVYCATHARAGGEHGPRTESDQTEGSGAAVDEQPRVADGTTSS